MRTVSTFPLFFPSSVSVFLSLPFLSLSLSLSTLPHLIYLIVVFHFFILLLSSGFSLVMTTHWCALYALHAVWFGNHIWSASSFPLFGGWPCNRSVGDARLLHVAPELMHFAGACRGLMTYDASGDITPATM